MSHTPHELHDEFPTETKKISALKAQDAHFAKLADAYHDLNRRIHRSETNVEPMDGLAETELRKRRAALKDEIAAILNAAQA